MKILLKALKRAPFLTVPTGKVYLVKRHKDTIDLVYFDKETEKLQIIYDKMVYVSSHGEYIRFPVQNDDKPATYIRLYLEDKIYGKRKTVY